MLLLQKKENGSPLNPLPKDTILYDGTAKVTVGHYEGRKRSSNRKIAKKSYLPWTSVEYSEPQASLRKGVKEVNLVQ